MGKEFTGNNAEPSQQPNSSTSTKTGSKGNTSTDTAAGTGTGRGRGRGTGTAEESGKLPGLVVVSDPNPVEIKLPASTKKEEPTAPPAAEPKPEKKPGRGRPPGSAAKKKPAPAAKQEPVKFDSMQLKLMLATFSGIVAARPGMEVWALQPHEIDQLAEPLSRMISRSAALSKMNEANADALALVVAVFVIFIPKFIQWKQTQPKKAKEGEKVTYGKPARTDTSTDKERTPEPSNRNNGRQATADSKTNGANDGSILSNLGSPVAGFGY